MENSRKELTPVHYTANAIKVLHTDRKPNATCFRPHWHDRIEILRVHQGEMLIDYGASSATVSAGQLIFLSPKMPHKAISGNAPLIYDVLMFDVRSFYNATEVCQTYLPAIYDGRIRFHSISSHPDIIRCFDTICASSDQEDLAITAGIYQLLSLFLQHNLLSFDSGNKRSVVGQIMAYLEENYHQELSTASVSAAFGYTSAHLCRKFKESTGLTPMNYLKIYRLELAFQKLNEEKNSISEIAFQCGFTDANYFTRCFKSHFGFPPTHYKKNPGAE